MLTLGAILRHWLSAFAPERAHLINIILPNARKLVAKGGQNFGKGPRVQRDGDRLRRA